MIFASLLAIAFAAFGLLAWRDLNMAMIALLALLPAYLVRFSIGPVPMTILEGLMLIVIGVYIVKSFRRPGPLLLPHSWGRVYAGTGLVAISLLAVLIAPDHVAALGIWKAYFLEPILFGAVMMAVFGKNDYGKALRALGISGAVIGLLAIAQVITKIGLPEAWLLEGRATSIFPYPNAVGLLLAPIATAMTIRLFQRWQASRTRTLRDTALNFGFDAFCIVLMLGGVVAAKTEAALVAIPATLFLIAMMAPTISRGMKQKIAVGSAVIAMMVLALVPSVVSKLTLHDTSGLVRRSQWSETLKMLADRSIFGAGLNGYQAALAPYHTATEYEIFQYPHNIFLNVWSELGVIGLMGLIGLMAWTTYSAWTHRKEPLMLVSFGALVTMSVHGLVDVPFFKNDLAVMTVFFLVMAVGCEGIGNRVLGIGEKKNRL
jgi:O-antigen ligase